MKCRKCVNTAVYEDPRLCKAHFIEFVEHTAHATVKVYGLAKKGERIAVACSGGKDSCTLLYLLKKFGHDVVAVSIDEGIKGYRDESLEHLKEFCREHDVTLEIQSFEDSFGKPLDDMDTEKVGGMPCTTCGTLRRYLLNKGSAGYDKIAVGHNMDDEAQSVLMNLFRANVRLMKRQGPMTENIEGFTQRIKPLYFLKEREIATYAFLMGFMDEFTECPNAHLAYRIWLRDLLNDYEAENPGTKENIISQQVQVSSRMVRKGGPVECERCGEPSSKEICQACRIKEKIKEKQSASFINDDLQNKVK